MLVNISDLIFWESTIFVFTKNVKNLKLGELEFFNIFSSFQKYSFV